MSLRRTRSSSRPLSQDLTTTSSAPADLEKLLSARKDPVPSSQSAMLKYHLTTILDTTDRCGEGAHVTSSARNLVSALVPKYCEVQAASLQQTQPSTLAQQCTGSALERHDCVHSKAPKSERLALQELHKQRPEGTNTCSIRDGADDSDPSCLGMWISWCAT
ncbi:hypothetical protein EJ03DRAFT_192807 [Teratosphaeria nubilosa]|uniref:Uncharacterized protein n=1 Tax=Teratosphaeria nubilosa TaxID=161662 RepID=A0A6G1KZT8_9PEZI|nr:hypothetical protein EJ03DRAFT_192807 [Teratosphaeria nubilosa]